MRLTRKHQRQLESFSKVVIEEIFSCYGFKKKRSFLSETSQLAIEGILLVLNEFLKEVGPAFAIYVKECLKLDLERISR